MKMKFSSIFLNTYSQFEKKEKTKAVSFWCQILDENWKSIDSATLIRFPRLHFFLFPSVLYARS